MRNREIRAVLIDYLRERQPSMDFVSLKDLALMLVRQFWRDLEAHHPGISSFNLAPEVAAGWRQRATMKTALVKDATGTQTVVHSPRQTANTLLTCVRAFYLDLAEWALQEPARWGPYVAPSPVQAKHLNRRKQKLQIKSRMDQRTRERMPLLPALVRTAHQRLHDASVMLRAASAAESGHDFVHDEHAFHRLRQPHSSRRTLRIRDSGTLQERDVAYEESAAFWAWAAIEVLRLTGIRIEELLELSHHALIQYRLPDTGEIIPLLQIVPSKTDAERLLVVSPELADVLSAIITRVRAGGAVPMVTAYDRAEQIWNPPSPLLFQRVIATEHRAFTPNKIRNLIAATAEAAGIDIRFMPHDFRRIFTDAIMSGLPPHIAQVICDHADINTTMGYKAVYPQEAISSYRAFLARRRSTRPAAEYRSITDEEWKEFIGHFVKRKVALGDCGRAFQSPCIHEHVFGVPCCALIPPNYTGCTRSKATCGSASPRHSSTAGSVRSRVFR